MKGKTMKTKLKLTVLGGKSDGNLYSGGRHLTQESICWISKTMLPRREPSWKTGNRLFRKQWRKHMPHPESCTFRQELTLSGKPSI